MNIVYFKVDNLPHEKTNQVNFQLKNVELLRDGDVIATPGDINVTALPFFYFCSVPTGFRKIEFRMNNNPPARVVCSAGYLKTGDYLVNTPEGEIVLPFNALNGMWTLDKTTAARINHQDFMARAFTLIRPIKSNNRPAPLN
ncbi:hypothetical protein Q5705_04195 [Kosakonia sp. H02]|nr:hypothetical protein Q5705_04195 [Kosakonia sp. H02]